MEELFDPDERRPATAGETWCVKAGPLADRDRLFIKNNFVAVGCARLGDLRRSGPRPEAIRGALQRTCPEAGPNFAGVADALFQFAYEVQLGDWVVYPCGWDSTLYLARVRGEYFYDPNLMNPYGAYEEEGYANVRLVEWVSSRPRHHFSPGALASLDQPTAFFRVWWTAADELRRQFQTEKATNDAAQ